MKSTASYFSVSPPLIKENLRRYWAIPAISFLVYFLSGIFPILISYGELDTRYFFIGSMLQNHHPIFMMAHLFVPVITSVVVFRYLQTGASVTMLHSMPFTRAGLFNSSVLSGLILAVSPMLLTGVILLLISKPVIGFYAQNIPYLQVGLNEGANVFARADIANWMWESFIIILFIYMIATFAGILSGNSLMHIFAGFGFNFLVPALFGIFTLYCRQYLYGFALSNEWEAIVAGLSPYLLVFRNGGGFPIALQAIYIAVAFALFAVSMLLYYNRKFERTSDSFVFNFMIPVVSYLIAFFGMSLLGFYFDAIGNGGNFHYVGLLSGAVIFLLIGRMIAKKTFRIFDKRTAQSLGLYLMIAAVFVFSFTLDLTGYEKRVPAESRINGVIISNHISLSPGRELYPEIDTTLSSSENIALFREFHKSIIENHGDIAEASRYSYYAWTNLHYDMKGIWDMSRLYSLDYEFLKDSKELARIFESDEYKSKNGLLNIDLSGLDSINIRHPLDYTGRSVLILSNHRIRELLERIDADFKLQTYESALSFQNPYAEVSFTFTHPGPDSNMQYVRLIRIPRDYKNTIQWLSNNGYAEQI